MTWVENNPYKMAVIASIIVSLGAAIIHYKQTNFNFYPEQFFSWLPIVWAMVFIFPASCSLINWVNKKRDGVLQ